MPQTQKIITHIGYGSTRTTHISFYATGTIDMFMARDKRSQQQPKSPKNQKGNGGKENVYRQKAGGRCPQGIHPAIKASGKETPAKDRREFPNHLHANSESSSLTWRRMDRSIQLVYERRYQIDISLGRMSCPTLCRHHPSVRPA